MWIVWAFDSRRTRKKEADHTAKLKEVSFSRGTQIFDVYPDSKRNIIGRPSSGKQNGKATLKAELQRHGIDFSVRDLKVGDFLWTCQGRDSNGEVSFYYFF